MVKILDQVKVRSSPICLRVNKERPLPDDRFKIYWADEGLHYKTCHLRIDLFETKDICRAS